MSKKETKNKLGGVLPPKIMAYMGRLRPRRVPYSGFRYTLQAIRGALAAGREKGRRACNYVSGI